MIQILKRFGWTWVGLLVSDDDYGLHVARSFQSNLAQSGGGCLAYSEVLPWGNDPTERRRIVEVMKKSTARVVMVFAHEIHIYQLMEEVWFNSCLFFSFVLASLQKGEMRNCICYHDTITIKSVYHKALNCNCALYCKS